MLIESLFASGTLVDIFPVLIIGFGLGFMHALDADHVMAVSMLSNQKPGLKKTLFYSAHWAIGHGAILLLCGVSVFGLGIAIPPSLQWLAEASVGVLLILLGVSCFHQFRHEKITLHTHRHGDIEHTHWQYSDHTSRHENSAQDNSAQDMHKPVMIGIMHGMAGSAPALALIPAVAQGELAFAVFYLALFSIGVMLSMIFFGFGFAYSQRFLQKRYHAMFYWSRRILAGVSIFLGGFWLTQTLV